MYLIDYLKQYKQEFIDLGTTVNQKNFLKDIFVKWYINCDKIGHGKIFPAYSILTESCCIDLLYANVNKHTNFTISTIKNSANLLYVKYKALCANIINNPNESDDEDEDYWESTKKILNKSQISRLRSLYHTANKTFIGFSRHFKYLLNLYEFIEIDSTVNLSIPPIFSGVELFGSCVNTHNKEFCSLFELEKRFTSLGSFWDYKFHREGFYLCNPPFDEQVIKKMALKLIDELTTSKFDVIVVITIPVWDSFSQNYMNIKNFNMEFEGYNYLINNSFIKEKLILDKNMYPYWDYTRKQKVASCYTHLITLSNLSDTRYKEVFDMTVLTNAWYNF